MLEKKNAPVGTCNLLLVLGMLEDGERAGHEIITALERQCDRTFSGQEGAIYPLTSAPASVRMADGRAACTV